MQLYQTCGPNEASHTQHSKLSQGNYCRSLLVTPGRKPFMLNPHATPNCAQGSSAKPQDLEISRCAGRERD